MSSASNDVPDWARYMSPAELEREAMDYEENARYDRYDGYRDEFLGSDTEDCESPDDYAQRVDYFRLGDDAGYRGAPKANEEFLLDDCDDQSYRDGYEAGRARRKSEDTDIPF